MGTRLGLHLEGPRRDELLDASCRMLEEVERIEAACSTRRPSSLWSRLNGAGGKVQALPAEWLDLLAAAQDWSLRTRGAFDPVVGSLMRAWGVREGGSTPTEVALAQARQACGSELLELDRRSGTAQLSHPDAGIEEGGFVKGHALDAARQVGRVPRGWLDFGGQILAWGRSLEVAIAAAEDRRSPRITILLPDSMSISCSGCSERGRHLLDPRTGRPCPDWGTVAVIAGSGLDAEALSTALYVEGPEGGPARAEEIGSAAVFLSHGGGIRTTSVFQRLRPAQVAGGCP